MQALHQKNLLDSDTQLNIFIAEDIEFPPHWHEAVEIVYVLEGNLKIGVNNEVYSLDARDIFVISRGEVHYFLPLPKPVKRIILHFEMSYFEAFASAVKNKKFTRVLFKESDLSQLKTGIDIHEMVEKQILDILDENSARQQGYSMALKARLFDILVILLRNVPMEVNSLDDRNKYLQRLERLEQVFRYVEQNFDNHITLGQIAGIANFSIFHFTRFFKEATGMTFGQYINNYRVSKAEENLANFDISITEIAFKTGFGSVKTFNRVFKQIKGNSPSGYRKAKFD